MILLETMVNCENTNWIIPQLGYTHYSSIQSLNHVGGIWSLWNNNNVEVTVVAKEPRILHCMVLDKHTAK